MNTNFSLRLMSFTLMMFPFFAIGQWTATGNNIYNTNTGNIGIGTTAPAFKLQVNGGAVYVSQAPNNDYFLFDHAGINTWRTRITTDNTSSYIIGNDLGGAFFNTKILT